MSAMGYPHGLSEDNPRLAIAFLFSFLSEERMREQKRAIEFLGAGRERGYMYKIACGAFRREES
jgi:hypothetical protein